MRRLDAYLSPPEIVDISLLSWQKLWSSRIGDEISLNEVELPATVIGYFFQKLFAHELSRRYPLQWQGERLKHDKDLVNLINPLYSTEMKASGQLGYALFGNRSYNQQAIGEEKSGKDKSGYYITLNFYKQAITLIRVGWIDQDDWIPQGAATGQAAILKKEVYEHKLIPLEGAYQLDSPIQLLNSVGGVLNRRFTENGIFTFRDAILYRGYDSTIIRVIESNREILGRLSVFI